MAQSLPVVSPADSSRLLLPYATFISAVTHASLENWEYMEIIRKAADPKCSAHLEKSIQTIDTILAISHLKSHLKGLFGLADLKHDEDFASLLEVTRGT